MKTHVKKPLFTIVFVAFFLLFLLLLFYFIQVANENKVFQGSTHQNQPVNKASLGLPERLMIPAINVNAAIQNLGVTTKGAMAVPSNTVDVGWFKLGPRPGEKGSAVIAGHFDGENGEAGVFTNLNKLKKGDKLYIEDNKGISVVFIVQESRIYNPGYADEVFSGTGSAHLNLITCDGVWDGAKKSYSKRLVVFTDIAQ
jgi:LPXTG-site transpeptidase (sortase) family protein